MFSLVTLLLVLKSVIQELLINDSLIMFLIHFSLILINSVYTFLCILIIIQVIVIVDIIVDIIKPVLLVFKLQYFIIKD